MSNNEFVINYYDTFEELVECKNINCKVNKIEIPSKI